MTLSTRTIYLKLQDSPMRTFLANWVMFEDLVVDIHRTGRLEEDDQHLLSSLRYAIKHHYHQWAEHLRPYWQNVKIAGRALAHDPFEAMLDTSVFASHSGTYDAVQTLAVVRETFNLMVVDHLPD